VLWNRSGGLRPATDLRCTTRLMPSAARERWLRRALNLPHPGVTPWVIQTVRTICSSSLRRVADRLAGVAFSPPPKLAGRRRSLLHRALSWAGAQHVSRVVLVTRADNEPAVRLFRHAGFQVASDGNGLLEMTASPLGQVQTR
jgi:GNAT superfamily N-acetyltransferase